MLNRVVLVGRLTKDPDLRYTPNGVAVANFTMAVNRPFTNQSGNREADFIKCVVWRRPAENLANYMKKGNMIGVDGRVQTRSFEGDDGKTVYITEIVADSIQFLETKGGNEGGGNQSQNRNANQNQNNNRNNNQDIGSPYDEQYNNNKNDEDPFKNNGQPIDISDDDLPF